MTHATLPVVAADVTPSVSRQLTLIPPAPSSSPPPQTTPTQDLDRAVRAGIAKLTGGLAPTALAAPISIGPCIWRRRPASDLSSPDVP